MALAFAASSIVVACSDAAPGGTSCRIQLAGDTSETDTLPANCATVSAPPDGGAGSVLTLNGTTGHLASLSVTVSLGDPPSPGVYSSASLAGWSIVGVVAGDSNCTYSAGNGSVPEGSLLLTVTQVEGGTAHGTLKATLSVHAPLFTDCGPSDFEEVAFAF